MFSPLAKRLLTTLPPRHREVLLRRYGFSGEPETLEAVGEDFDITRERVRQIENVAFDKLRASGAEEEAEAAFKRLSGHLEEHGKLRREERFLEEIAPSKERPAVLFLLDLGDSFDRHRETDHRHTVWATDEEAVDVAEDFIKKLSSYLSQEVREALDERAFWKMVEERARVQGLRASEKALRSFVDAAKMIHQGPFGNWGLAEWPDVSPRGAGDRAWLVLRKEHKPLHFTDLAEQINKYFKAKGFRPVHMQTVHNELIKDDRFVLIGRGLYALSDWGYAPGPVKDVVAALLRKAPKPLSRDEILEKVLAERMVKPATVILSLSDRKKFTRTPEGRYSLRA